MRACKRTCFVRDAFLQATVTAKHVGVVVDDFAIGFVKASRKMGFGCRHTNGGCDPLSQGARGGFYTNGVTIFGVTCGGRAKLTEGHQIFLRQTEPIQVQKGVIHCRTVTSGKHETVAIVPSGILGVKLQEFLKERVGNRGATQGKTRVAGFCFFNGFRGQDANGVDGSLLYVHGNSPIFGARFSAQRVFCLFLL